MARILFGELTRKDLSTKMDIGEERNSEFYPTIFPLEFLFFACNAPMICIGHNQLVSSAGIGRFIIFKSLRKKKCDG